MEITYPITQGDFVDALRSHRDRTPVREWGLRLVLSIAFGVAGIGLILVVAEPGTQTLSTFAPLFVISVLRAFLWWGGPRWSARTQYRKQPSVQGPRNTTLDEKGVSWKWDGGSADVEWKNFHRWQESKTQFILYTSPMMFNMLPKWGAHARANFRGARFVDGARRDDPSHNPNELARLLPAVLDSSNP